MTRTFTGSDSPSNHNDTLPSLISSVTAGSARHIDRTSSIVMRRLCYRIGALTRKKARRTSPSPRSLKVTDAFKTFVLEQLADLEDLTARAMFGGVGLYARGDFFGIIARDRL